MTTHFINYDWILFDADQTLFHFNAFLGLQRMFSKFNVPFNEADYHAYQSVNLMLWEQYHEGTITADTLKSKRFEKWAKELNVEAMRLNDDYLTTMVDISHPLDGALPLLDALKNNVKMGIITNGFKILQDIRLQRHDLQDHFELLVISEEVGIPKPHTGIFTHALQLMGNPDPQRVLMVGDTPETDILGGNNAGLKTCWLNPGKKVSDIKAHYEVSSLIELHDLLKS